MSKPLQISLHLGCIIVSFLTFRFRKIPYFLRGIGRAMMF